MKKFLKDTTRFKGSAIITCIYTILMISLLTGMIACNNIIFNKRDNAVETILYIYTQNRINEIKYQENYVKDRHHCSLLNNAFGMYDHDYYFNIVDSRYTFKRLIYYTTLDDGTIVITDMEVYGE